MLTGTSESNPPVDGLESIDDIEQELVRLEGLVSQVRTRQLELLREIDRLQVPYWDGTRSLKEWIAGRLDVHPRTAGDLAVLAKAEPGPIGDALRAGVTSVDRAAGTTRLANAGADAATLHKADGIAVGQLGRLNARQRRMRTVDHHEAFRMRRVWFQPNLANTLAIGSITMAGADCDMFLAGLDERADEIVDPADPNRPRLEQRRVDALVSLALDAATGHATDTEDQPATARRRLKAHIFVDAAMCSRTNGEAGATTRLGIKVGPNTPSKRSSASAKPKRR